MRCRFCFRSVETNLYFSLTVSKQLLEQIPQAVRKYWSQTTPTCCCKAEIDYADRLWKQQGRLLNFITKLSTKVIWNTWSTLTKFQNRKLQVDVYKSFIEYVSLSLSLPCEIFCFKPVFGMAQIMTDSQLEVNKNWKITWSLLTSCLEI